MVRGKTKVFIPRKTGVIHVKSNKNRVISSFDITRTGKARLVFREQGIGGFLKKPIVKIISPPKTRKVIGIRRTTGEGFDVSYGVFKLQGSRKPRKKK